MPHLAYIIEWNKQRAAVGSIQLSPSLHAIQGSCFQPWCTMKTVDREILCCRFVKSQRTNCCSCHCSLICTSLCGSERWRWCCLCLTRLTSSWCRCFFCFFRVFRCCNNGTYHAPRIFLLPADIHGGAETADTVNRRALGVFYSRKNIYL